jgi:hypothetical protein
VNDGRREAAKLWSRNGRWRWDRLGTQITPLMIALAFTSAMPAKKTPSAKNVVLPFAPACVRTITPEPCSQSAGEIANFQLFDIGRRVSN